MADNQQRQKKIDDLRRRLQNVLPAHLATDFNLQRWIGGYKEDVDEAHTHFRSYLENRGPAGVDRTNFLSTEDLLAHPVVKKYVSYFSLSLTPGIFNRLDNTLICIQHFGGVDFNEITKVMTCGQILWLNYVLSEWMLRQVLHREQETGRKAGVTIIYDFENFHAVNIISPTSPLRKIMKTCLGVLQNEFCGILHRLLIVNMSATASAVLSIIKAFLHKETKEKLILVSDIQTLPQFVDRNQLPASYGGNWRLTAAECQLDGLGTSMDPNKCVSIHKPISPLEHVVPVNTYGNTVKIRPKQTHRVQNTIAHVPSELTWRYKTSSEVVFGVVRVERGNYDFIVM